VGTRHPVVVAVFPGRACPGGRRQLQQTGAYVIVAVVFCWLIIPALTTAGLLVLLGGALLVIAAYVSLMIVKYDPPGNPYFIHQSLVQSAGAWPAAVRRHAHLAQRCACNLLTQQYKYFLPSLIVAVCAVRGSRCAGLAVLPGALVGSGAARTGAVRLAGHRGRGVRGQQPEVPASTSC